MIAFAVNIVNANPFTKKKATKDNILIENDPSNYWQYWSQCAVSPYTQWPNNRSNSLEWGKESTNISNDNTK